MKRFLWLGSVVVLFVIGPGCGDVFRPIIIPNPPVFPSPQAAHSVVTISDNGTIVSGSAMVIDVSGDTDVSIKNVGLRPVHAVQQTAAQVIVVNESTPAAATDSVTKLTFAGTVIGTTTTITLPANSAPTYVTAAPNDTKGYVTLPGYIPDPVNHPNDNGVAVIDTNANGVPNIITVGNDPEALAITPDKTKLYVANFGDGTLGAYNTSDLTPRTITGSPTSTPIWLSARSDSQQVYVLEQHGILAWLNTQVTGGPDTLTETLISVPNAVSMVYDPILNRLYIPGGSQVTIVDVSQSAPASLASIPISAISPSSRTSGDPCATTTVASALSVLAAAALPDGSRAYVGSYYLDNAGNVCPQVTVINSPTTSVKTTVAIPGFPAYSFCASTRFRFTMAAGGDSSRAYLASCDGGNVNIVNTATDTYFLNLPAPSSTRPPIPPSTQNPPQNPVFMLAGP